MRRAIWCMSLALLACGTAAPAFGAGEKMPLRIGFWFDGKYVGEDYSKKDLIVATEMIFGQVLSEGEFDPSFHRFEKSADFVAAIEAGELDYIEMKPLLWLEMPEETKKRVELLSIVQLCEERLERFVLLAAPGETLASLKGKKIRIHENNDRGIGRMWLEHQLREQLGVDKLSSHFGKVEKHGKQDEVLLPTFFGRADACLVRIEDYQVVGELNPQVSQLLQPVATSPGFPFIIVGAAGPSRARVAERLGGEKSHGFVDHSRGRQAFSLLGVHSISSFKEGDLDALESIVDSAAVKPEGDRSKDEQEARLTSRQGAEPE